MAVAAPGIALPRQRPARPAVKPRRAPARLPSTRRPAQEAPGIALRAVGAFEAVSASAALDRLIRGRVWIGLLAFSLIGIVAMQLVVLELNTGIGRTLTREAALQRENAQLGIEDSTYSAESRVAPLAAAAGMTLAPLGTVHFLQAAPADVSRAAAALAAPIQASAGSHASSTEATAAPESSTAGGARGTTEATAAPESSTAGGAPRTAEGGGARAATEAPGGSSSPEASGSASGSGSGTASGEAATSSPATSTGTAATTETGGSTEASGSSSSAGG
jgi:cell division protein FtsL